MHEGPDPEIRLAEPCLVVLVGSAGSGKSTWAVREFGEERVVSSDRLRAVVGMDESDQGAGGDAFAVLDVIVGADEAGADDSDRLDRPGSCSAPQMALARRRRRHACVSRRHRSARGGGPGTKLGTGSGRS